MDSRVCIAQYARDYKRDMPVTVFVNEVSTIFLVNFVDEKSTGDPFVCCASADGPACDDVLARAMIDSA